MTHTAVAVLVLTLLAPSLDSEPARACSDYSRSRTVVGVARDGRFVLVDTWWASNGRTDIEIRDSSGALETTIHFCKGECPDLCGSLDPAAGATCRASPYQVHSEGKAPPVDIAGTPKAVAARLSAALSLTPLGASKARMAVDELDGETNCIISVLTNDGSVPVGSTQWFESCSAVKAKARTHRHTTLSFVEYRYQRVGTCSEDITGTHWFPTSRVAARQPYYQGLKRPADAEVLRRVIAADPGFLPARSALLKLLFDSKLPWTKAAEQLAVPFPKTVSVGSSQYASDINAAWTDPDYLTWAEAHLNEVANSVPE